MSETTNLKLFKHDNPSTNTNQFNVEISLNGNWDKIDEFAGGTDRKIEEAESKTEILEQEYAELKENLDNILPPGQAGPDEDITINDSAKYPCKIEVGGNSWQKTRTGKNKFDYKNANIKANSYININTGEITTTSNTNYATENYIEIEQQNYSIPAATSNFRLAFYSAEKVFISSKNNNFINFEVPENAKYIRFSDTNLSNIMLLEGNTEDTEYEEYGASPSTKYPSDLEAVGDSESLKVTVSNKNMFNKNNFEEISGQFQSGYIAYNYNEKILYFKCKKNCSYAFQKKIGTLYKRFSVAETKEKPELNVALQNNPRNADKDSLVYTTSAEAEYIVFWYYSTGSDLTKEEILDSIQIEEGNEPTYYIAHEEQNAIFPFSEGQRLLKNCKLGDTEIIQNRKRIVLDGTENWVFGNKLTKTINFLLNNFSGYANTGSNSANAICTHFKGNENGADIDEACFWFNGTGGFRIRIEIDELADVSTNEKCVESFKSYLAQQYSTGTPVELEYELAEPETTPYTEAQKTAKAEIDKLKTYKGVTYITTDSKAILDVSYKKDLEILINNLSNAGEG